MPKRIRLTILVNFNSQKRVIAAKRQKEESMKEEKRAQRANIQRHIARIKRQAVVNAVLFYIGRIIQATAIVLYIIWVLAVDSLPSDHLLADFAVLTVFGILLLAWGEIMAVLNRNAIIYKLEKIEFFEKKLEAISRKLY